MSDRPKTLHVLVRPIHTLYIARDMWRFGSGFTRVLGNRSLIEGVRHDVAAAATGYASYVRSAVKDGDVLVALAGVDEINHHEVLAHQTDLPLPDVENALRVFAELKAQERLLEHLRKVGGGFIVLEPNVDILDHDVLKRLSAQGITTENPVKVLGETKDDCIAVGINIRDRGQFNHVALVEAFVIDELLFQPATAESNTK